MNNKPMTCDPARIELFLEQKLTDREQTVFELHLDECSDCRRRLEASAASDDVWSGVRESLNAEPLIPYSQQPSSGAAFDSAAGGDGSFCHDTVLKLLAPTDDDRSIGRLGTYEVMGVIGSGGMGVVLKAFDGALNRYVAIKVLAPHLGSSGAARKRFSREAQAAAAVVHDNVIEIHGVAQTNGLPYLVMPYIPGASLQRRLDNEGPLAPAEILRIAVQAASGLAAAHAQGLVHRDVKPANILLTDGVERVKLTDFGLARAADDASLTKTGFIAGTPQFMSPEQARGESVDQRSDLFSLGCVLYAMCTGRPPFRAETSYGVLRRITDEEPRPIREINPDIPEWLCQIIARLMAKQPDGRFQSAREVAELLENCLAHVQQPTAVPQPEQLRVAESSARVERSRWSVWRLLAGTAFALALLLAGVVVALELNKGTLTIESDADDVAVRITQGEAVVEKLTVTRAGKQVRVAAGTYVVEIEGEADGITVENGIVTIQRRGTEIVRIVRRNASASLDDKGLDRARSTTSRWPKPVPPEEPFCVVRGKLVDRDGKAIPKKPVWIVGTRDGDFVLYQDGPTKADGSFEFDDVPADIQWRFFIPFANGPEGDASRQFKLSPNAKARAELVFDGEQVTASVEVENGGEGKDPGTDSALIPPSRRFPSTDPPTPPATGVESKPRSAEATERAKKYIETLDQRVKALEEAYRAGEVSLKRVVGARLDLLEARLELANSVEERIGILKKQVAILSDLEKAVTALHKNGVCSLDEVLAARADRIEAEKRLHREREPQSEEREGAVGWGKPERAQFGPAENGRWSYLDLESGYFVRMTADEARRQEAVERGFDLRLGSRTSEASGKTEFVAVLLDMAFEEEIRADLRAWTPDAVRKRASELPHKHITFQQASERPLGNAVIHPDTSGIFRTKQGTVGTLTFSVHDTHGEIRYQMITKSRGENAAQDENSGAALMPQSPNSALAIDYRGRCVRSEDGEPVSRAMIRFFTYRDEKPHLQQWKRVDADSNGRFAIQGTIRNVEAFDIHRSRISVTAPGRASRTFFWQDSPEEVRLELQPAASLTGRVTSPDGKPVVRAFVYLGPLQVPNVHEALTDEDGRFEIKDVAAADEIPFGESNTLVVTHPDFDKQTIVIKRIPSHVDVQLTATASGTDHSNAVHDSGGPPQLDGTVLSVSEEQGEISVGHDDGVRKGQRFHVFDGPTYVGRVDVINVEADKSVVRIDAEDAQRPVRRGDRVTTHGKRKTPPGAENADAARLKLDFQQTISGKWILKSVEMDGELFDSQAKDDDPLEPDAKKKPPNPESAELMHRYRIAVLDRDRVSFRSDAEHPVAPWSYTLQVEADPRRMTLTTGEKTIKAIVWASKRQMVLALAVEGGDYPQGFESAGNSHLVLRYERDETDPHWLRQEAANLRQISKELLLHGNSVQQETAREFIEFADSLERESEIREQSQSAQRNSIELRRQGNMQQANSLKVEADKLRLQADTLRAERFTQQRLRLREQYFRDEVQRLNLQAGVLRQQGRFDEAGQVDLEIRELLRDRDPDLQRANELKRRAAEARLDGKHQDADLFDRQAEELIQRVRDRYERDDAAPSTAPADQPQAAATKDEKPQRNGGGSHDDARAATDEQISVRVVFVKSDARERVDKSEDLSATDKSMLRKFLTDGFLSDPPVIDDVKQGSVNFDRDLVNAMLRKMSSAGVAHVDISQQRTISLNQWATIKLAALSSVRDDNERPIEVDWRARLRVKKDGRVGMQLCRALGVAAESAPEADQPASTCNLIRFQPDEAAIMPWHFHFLEEDRRDSLVENQGGDRFLVVQLAETSSRTFVSARVVIPVNRPDGLDELMRTCSDVLRSNLVLEKAMVTSKLDALPLLSAVDDRIQWLRDNLIIRKTGRDRVIEVGLTGSDARQLLLIVEAVADEGQRLFDECFSRARNSDEE